MRKTLFTLLVLVQVIAIGGLAWLFLGPAPARRAASQPQRVPTPDPVVTPAVREDTVFHDPPVAAADPVIPPHVDFPQGGPAAAGDPVTPVAPPPPADPLAPPTGPPGKPRLAILPFKVLGGKLPPEVGNQMADYFASQVTTDKYDPVERSQLAELVHEQRLQQTDLFDAGRMLKLARAQYALVGTLTPPWDADGPYQLTARVVSLDGRIGERGGVTFDKFNQYAYRLGDLARQMRLAQPAGPVPPPFDELRDAINPRATFHVAVQAADGKAVYHPGDMLTLKVTADRDCFVTLVSYVGGDGVQLVPNRYMPGGRVLAKVPIYYPPEHKFRMPIGAPFGKTVVRVIGTAEPLDLGIPASTVADALDLPVPAGAARKLLDLDPTTWATDGLTIVSEPGGATTTPPSSPATAPPDASIGGRPTTGPATTGPSTAGPSTAGPSTAGPSTAGPSTTGPSTAGPSTAAAAAVDPNQSVLSEWQALTGATPVRGTSASPVALGSLGRYGVEEALVIPVDGGGGGRLLGPVGTVKVGGGVGLQGVGGDDAALAIARLRKPGTVVVSNIRLRAYDGPSATRLFVVQWALHNRFRPGADVNWDAVADRVATAPTPLIGLVDSGIDLDDDRLRPTAWTNPRPGDFQGCTDDLHGWNFVTGTGTLFVPGTKHSHGSACASIIAGRPAGRADDVVGICPTARLVTAVGLMSPAGTDGPPTGNLASVLRSIAYCAQEGAQVINLSLGGPVSDDDLAELQKLPLWDELERRNVVLVCAAGNDYQDIDAHPVFPACLRRPNVVCVMAVDAAGRLATDRGPGGAWEPFSNYGKASVHLAAPGTQILGIPAHDGVGLETGTSFAAPIVTGTVALIQGRHPDWTYKQVIKALLDNVRPVAAIRDRCATGGVVNVGRALD